MKIAVIILLQFIFVFHTAYSQQSQPISPANLEMNQLFLKKRNINNNAGWICVTGGVLIRITGVLKAVAGAVAPGPSSDHNVNTGNTIFIVGNVVALSSIPFFVAAHQYKRKAQLALKGEVFRFNNKSTYTYPGVALSVRF